eukprot:scaffold241956_cov29-Tisochrysis_lutea.AAC.4
MRKGAERCSSRRWEFEHAGAAHTRSTLLVMIRHGQGTAILYCAPEYSVKDHLSMAYRAYAMAARAGTIDIIAGSTAIKDSVERVGRALGTLREGDGRTAGGAVDSPTRYRRIGSTSEMRELGRPGKGADAGKLAQYHKQLAHVSVRLTRKM